MLAKEDHFHYPTAQKMPLKSNFLAVLEAHNLSCIPNSFFFF